LLFKALVASAANPSWFPADSSSHVTKGHELEPAIPGGTVGGSFPVADMDIHVGYLFRAEG
jgi:hypothetical protein